jgi:hypothetical protein
MMDGWMFYRFYHKGRMVTWYFSFALSSLRFVFLLTEDGDFSVTRRLSHDDPSCPMDASLVAATYAAMGEGV